MRIIIDQKILKKYPKINIGVLVFQDINVKESNTEVEKIKRDVEELVRASGYTVETISEHPLIRTWREIYRSFGAKPSKFRCSAEALLRRILKGEHLPQVNTLVDLYNSISVKYYLPIGGYDYDKIEGDIFLRFSKIGDFFLPLRGDTYEFLEEGEVVYANSSKVICRKWNYRDCEQTKITTDTKNAILFIDGAEKVKREVVENALTDLEELVLRICGGKSKKKILSLNDPLWII